MDPSGQSEYQLQELPVSVDYGRMADTYERYKRRYGTKIFSSTLTPQVDEGAIAFGVQSRLIHLDEVQSRAMKKALFASVEVVDGGFLAE